MESTEDLFRVPHPTRGPGILQGGTKGRWEISLEIGLHQLNPDRFCPGGQDCFGLGKQVSIDKKHLRI
ncbi:MAG: Uncharacterised protein [Cellulomonadaceae bacterium TMED98]|nr:MAG: Uncharacterised protein [Cellulomonadaceae bacterium TMED98]